MRSIFIVASARRYSAAILLASAKTSLYRSSAIAFQLRAFPGAERNFLSPASKILSSRIVEKYPEHDKHYSYSTSTTEMSAKHQPRQRKSAKSKNADSPLSVPHVSEELLPSWMNKERTKILTTDSSFLSPTVLKPRESTKAENECVLYWMQRDVRTEDNWALLYAQHLAFEYNVPLRVFYTLPPPPIPSAMSTSDDMPPKVCDMPITERHGTFLLEGLKLVQTELHQKDVPLHVLMAPSRDTVGKTVHDFATMEDLYALAVVCDFNPLRQYRDWMERQAAPLLGKSGIPLFQVDAHNVVPCWYVSPKREVGARTLRPKINKLLQEFMTHFPAFEGNSHLNEKNKLNLTDKDVSWEHCKEYLNMDETVSSVDWIKPGTAASFERFQEFCNDKVQGLKNFDSLRNDPNYRNVCSNMSPWVNYGHVSFQRLALEVRALKKYSDGTAAYIEEGIVRRELSDNFVYYSPDNYDDLSSAAQWAQDSLQLHSSDKREYLYTLEEFKNSQTHDDLWNAAQMQLVKEGKMHGFMRMYWAKKILEWTESPAVALRTGLYLNDRYALDGNDPNGFVGVGWSVMGIHDMGWKERPIFGKIRFMNYAGCKRKFKVDTFVSRYTGAKENSIRALKKISVPTSDASKTRKKTQIF